LLLGRAQLDALFMLSQFDGIGVKDLAAQLNVTSGAISQVIDSLDGLVRVQTNPADRRGRIIRLTDRAMEEVRVMQADVVERARPRFDSLSSAELAELDRLLQKLRMPR